MKSPSALALNELAEILQGFRELHHRYRDTWAPQQSKIERLRNAAETLRDGLPEILADLKKCQELLSGVDFLVDRCREDMSAINSIIDGVSVVLVSPVALQSMPARSLGQFDRWTGLADSIAEAFRKAMQTTNPNVVLGNSSEGPVTRFVSAVIPEITGERPTLGYVANILKQDARRNRDKSCS